MASGLVSGYQHQLIDEPNLTKEKFVELCDKWFYHLERNDVKTKQDLVDYRTSQIKDYKNDILKYENLLLKLRSQSPDEINKRYGEYVEEVVESNAKRLSTFTKETKRMELVREYAAAMTPHLEYIWKDFKDPELFTSSIHPIDEWALEEIEHTLHSIKFYKQRLTEISQVDDPENEHAIFVADYENKRKLFLSEE